MDELSAAFASRLASDVGVDAGEVRDLVARARFEQPGIELDELAFVAHVAERVTFDVRGAPVLRPLHAGDLWIAFGCVTAAPAAIARFEEQYAPEIRTALRRSFEHALSDEAELRLRERLFLVGADEVPRLASYAGRGALRPWLRSAAVRSAIDLVRARRELPSDPDDFGELGSVDPLLARLKQTYRDEFRAAFAGAASELSDRDRTLLRYRFLDGLSIDEIGVLYRVHRATVARWIAAIREALFEGTRARLMAQLALGESDVDSVLRLIDSQLDVSIEALLR